jgi:putative peptidoglycan lipid II flippase
MVVNFVLSLALVWPFGVRGLAASLSIATIIEFVLLFRTLNRRMPGLGDARLAFSVMRTIASSVLMAEVILLWLALLELAGLLDLAVKLDAALAVLGGIAIGAGVYFYVSRILRSEEATTLLRRLPLPERLRAWAPGSNLQPPTSNI